MKKGDGQAYRVPQAPPNERLSVAGAERRDRDRASRKRAANQTLAVFLTALQGSACIVELDNETATRSVELPPTKTPGVSGSTREDRLGAAANANLPLPTTTAPPPPPPTAMRQLKSDDRSDDRSAQQCQLPYTKLEDAWRSVSHNAAVSQF